MNLALNKDCHLTVRVSKYQKNIASQQLTVLFENFNQDNFEFSQSIYSQNNAWLEQNIFDRMQNIRYYFTIRCTPTIIVYTKTLKIYTIRNLDFINS